MNSIEQFFNTPLAHPGSGVISIFGFLAVLSIIAFIWQLHILDDLVDALPKKKKFQEKSVLTENESEFFSRLKSALPELDVYPQMAMSALIEPAVPESDPHYWFYRGQFDRKVCDFVVCRKNCPPAKGVIVVIELDDRTHDKEKDAWRDRMLLSAGIETIRYESKAKPEGTQIRRDIKEVLKARRRLSRPMPSAS